MCLVLDASALNDDANWKQHDGRCQCEQSIFGFPATATLQSTFLADPVGEAACEEFAQDTSDCEWNSQQEPCLVGLEVVQLSKDRCRRNDELCRVRFCSDVLQQSSSYHD